MHNYTDTLIARGAIKVPAYRKREQLDIISQAVGAAVEVASDVAEDKAMEAARSAIEVYTQAPDQLGRALAGVVKAIEVMVREATEHAGLDAVGPAAEEYLDRNLPDQVNAVLDRTLDDAVSDTVNDAVEGAVGDALERSLGDAVEEALRGNNFDDRIDDIEQGLKELEDTHEDIEELGKRLADIEVGLNEASEQRKVDGANLDKSIESLAREIHTLQEVVANLLQPKPKNWLQRLLRL